MEQDRLVMNLEMVTKDLFSDINFKTEMNHLS